MLDLNQLKCCNRKVYCRNIEDSAVQLKSVVTPIPRHCVGYRKLFVEEIKEGVELTDVRLESIKVLQQESLLQEYRRQCCATEECCFPNPWALCWLQKISL